MYYLRKLVILIAILILVLNLTGFSSQNNDTPKTSEAFNRLVASNSYPVKLEGESLSGSGAEKIINEAKQHDFFFFGENHGALEVSKTAKLLYEQLNLDRKRLLVSEVSPMAARFAESLSRKGEFYQYFSTGLNLQTIPFFSFTEEASLLDIACKQNIQQQRCFLGLDQEFIAAYPLVNNYIETLSLSSEELQAFNALSFDNLINPFLFGMGNGSALKELKSDAENLNSDYLSSLADELLFTHKLYTSNMSGNYKWSNEQRETLIMNNFSTQMEELYSNNPPPLFFKFGGLHLFKGESTTVKKAFGARADEWAKSKGLTTLSVFVDGFSGEVTNGLFGFSEEINRFTNWNDSPFDVSLSNNQAILFDLRPLKNHQEVNNLSKNKQRLINGYDYLLLYKKVQPVGFIEGTFITRTYAGLALVTAFILFFLVVWLLFKGYKRLRKRSS